MNAEWVTAIATAGTFVVIAASAIAALLQLRHTRGSNQIVALRECREKLESEEFQDARAFLALRVPELMKDPESVRKLEQWFFPAELRPAGNVANFFESMGAFVRFNIIDRRIACDLWCGVVVSSWNAMLPTRAFGGNWMPAYAKISSTSRYFRKISWIATRPRILQHCVGCLLRSRPHRERGLGHRNRDGRGSNQIVALTECRETLEAPEFRAAQRFVSYALVRKRTGKDAIWENFEYLAVLGENHIRAHPGGTYPAGAGHMPVDYSLINTLEAATAVTKDG